jgi:putative redox protein
LAACLELPDGAPRGFALFAHCFTCSKVAAAATRISRALTDSGIAVLRFDFTGLGQSGGEFANTNFSSNVQDIVHAAEFVRSRYGTPSIHDLVAALLVMHSPVDDTVSIDNARMIFEAAKHPKSFVSIDGADHLLTDQEDAAYDASAIGARVGRYALTPASHA